MFRIAVILAICVFSANCPAMQFAEVATLPVGHNTPYGKLLAYDTNHDGYLVLIFFGSPPPPGSCA